jgi:hypothetical protein
MSEKEETPPDQPKRCFVIAPIGSDGTPERIRSDQIFRHIIEPVVSSLGYIANRSDLDEKPGLITDQIIQHLLVDELVVADLTGHNPNVMYELAIRHAIRKPVVQIIAHNESIPFDLKNMRTIKLNHQDLDSVEGCKRRLGEQIRQVENDATQVDSPITTAILQMQLEESANPEEKSLALLMRQVSDMSLQLHGLVQSLTSVELGSSRTSGLLEDLLVMRLWELATHGFTLPETEPSAWHASLMLAFPDLKISPLEAVKAFRALQSRLDARDLTSNSHLMQHLRFELINAGSIPHVQTRDPENGGSADSGSCEQKLIS